MKLYYITILYYKKQRSSTSDEKRKVFVIMLSMSCILRRVAFYVVSDSLTDVKILGTNFGSGMAGNHFKMSSAKDHLITARCLFLLPYFSQGPKRVVSTLK